VNTAQSPFDLDAYCRRIGYTGAREPSLATLCALHWLHPQAIPFENLDVVLRRPVRIDTDSLQRKLVTGGRGGYCFEQNLLFSHALKAIGFRVTFLTARVRYQVPADRPMPLTHMLLKVDLDSEIFLADAGFGANTLTAPLRLAVRDEQATPHEPFRVSEADGRHQMEIKLRGEWLPLYNFSLEPQAMVDLEVGNWYIATHPGSRFYDELAASRALPDGRYALSGNQLAIHRLTGTSERRVLHTESELREALIGQFGLTLPDDSNLSAAFARMTTGAV
jgi:N-hydroxyarylamine O-acetyltransferase